MEALAAIGLASNVLQLVEVGTKILSKARDVHQSAAGLTDDDASLASLTFGLASLSGELSSTASDKAVGQDAAHIHNAAMECNKTAQRLSKLLKETRARDSASKRHSVAAAFKSLWRSTAKKELIEQLERCINVLNVHLLNLTRSESIQKLDQLIQGGHFGGFQLESINAQIKSLREKIEVVSLGVEAVSDLRRILGSSNGALTKIRQRHILNSLKFDMMESRFEDVHDAHEKTFDWIVQEDTLLASDAQVSANTEFRKWLHEDGGIFHVAGKPGSGKSTLMKFVTEHESTQQRLTNWAGESQLVIAKFFFWRAGNKMQRSFKGMVRSILHSVLNNAPELIPVAFPDEWAESEMFTPGIQGGQRHDDTTILKVFQRLVQNRVLYNGRNIAFFIDGLDELEGNHAHMVRQLKGWVRLGEGKLKICAACREFNVFDGGFEGFPRIRLQDLTRGDMEHISRDTLLSHAHFQNLRVPFDTAEKFISTLVDKAEGVFLWTTLVLRLLEEGLENGDEMHHLQDKVDILPRELEELFEHILTSINEADRWYAFQMLNFVAEASALYPLLLIRLLFFELIIESRRTTTNKVEDFITDFKKLHPNEVEKELQRRILLTRKRLVGRCKGLLELKAASPPDLSGKGNSWVENLKSNPKDELVWYSVPHYQETVILAHRSVRDFLKRDHIKTLVNAHLGHLDWLEHMSQVLLVHLRFMVCRDDGFLKWPTHAELRQQQIAKVATDHPCDGFAVSFTVELQKLLEFAMSECNWTGSGVPPFFIQFLFKLDSDIKKIRRDRPSVDSLCPKARILPPRDFSLQGGFAYGVPVSYCGEYCNFGYHFSLHHLIAGYGIYEYFQKLFAVPMQDLSSEITDSGGLVAIVLRDKYLSSSRAVRTLELFFSHGLSPNYTYWKSEVSSPRIFGYRDIVLEKGSEVSCWHELLCRYLLGLYNSQNDSRADICEAMIAHGADTRFWLKITTKAKLIDFTGVRELIEETESVAVVEVWTGEANTDQSKVKASTPDHVPCMVYLLQSKSDLVKRASEHGDVLSLADILGYLKIDVSPSLLAKIETPQIPNMDGWKIGPSRIMVLHCDNPKTNYSVDKLLMESGEELHFHHDSDAGDQRAWVRIE